MLSDYARPIDPESDGVWRASLVAIHRRIYTSRVPFTRSIAIGEKRQRSGNGGKSFASMPGLCLIIIANSPLAAIDRLIPTLATKEGEERG